MFLFQSVTLNDYIFVIGLTFGIGSSIFTRNHEKNPNLQWKGFNKHYHQTSSGCNHCNINSINLHLENQVMMFQSRWMNCLMVLRMRLIHLDKTNSCMQANPTPVPTYHLNAYRFIFHHPTTHLLLTIHSVRPSCMRESNRQLGCWLL